MKQEMFTIKAKNKKLGGFSRVVGEVEFSQMIDKDNFEIIEESKPKRARNAKGQLKADDPSTPDVNEAYVGGKAPKKTSKKKSKKKTSKKKK